MTCEEQINRLAEFISTEFPDYVTPDARIDDVAIAIMQDYKSMLEIEWTYR